MTGKVARVMPTKGFGFILGADENDYFFHRDDFRGDWMQLVNDTFHKNTTVVVEFKQDKTDKGLRARNVLRVVGEGNHGEG